MADSPVVHLARPPASGYDPLPCCGRHPSTLPLGDSTTFRLDMVTCPGPDGHHRPAPDDSIEPPPTERMTDARLDEIRAVATEEVAEDHDWEHEALVELLAEVDYQRAENDRLRDENAAFARELSIARADHEAAVAELNHGEPQTVPCISCAATDWTCKNCGKAMR